MQPNQPVGSPAPGQNQYDFIMNPGKPPKKPLLNLGGGSFTKRIIVVVGGAVGLIIIIAIATSLLTSGSNGSVGSLKALAAQQQELARIAAIGADKAQNSTVRYKAATTELSVTSQQIKLTHYLESRNIKLSKEELASKKDGSVDKSLDEATSNNHFDEAFDTELTEQLNAYATALQEAYNSTSNENGKAVLSDSFSSTTAILGLK